MQETLNINSLGRDLHSRVSIKTKTSHKGPCKIYGLHGASENGANTLFDQFYALLFTPDTICADDKDKPMAGCKNQLIKKCLRIFHS